MKGSFLFQIKPFHCCHVIYLYLFYTDASMCATLSIQKCVCLSSHLTFIWLEPCGTVTARSNLTHVSSTQLGVTKLQYTNKAVRPASMSGICVLIITFCVASSEQDQVSAVNHSTSDICWVNLAVMSGSLHLGANYFVSCACITVKFAETDTYSPFCLRRLSFASKRPVSRSFTTFWGYFLFHNWTVTLQDVPFIHLYRRCITQLFIFFVHVVVQCFSHSPIWYSPASATMSEERIAV